jgi:hypothetical protein
MTTAQSFPNIINDVPPLSPAPSASICSSSCVAPPVMRDRIRVSAFGLKYVYGGVQL